MLGLWEIKKYPFIAIARMFTLTQQAVYSTAQLTEHEDKE